MRSLGKSTLTAGLKERLDTEAEAHRQDRWLVSYADFMTLLFAFFVVMYAISSVNTEKYRVLSAVLEETFDTPVKSLDPFAVGEPTLAASPHVVDVSDTPGYEDSEPGDTTMRTDAERVGAEFAGLIDSGLLGVESNQDWLEITLNGQHSFRRGSAELTVSVRQALASLADFLRPLRAPVTIEGYTDNIPIAGSRFGSNWSLSAARAARVADFLEAQGIRRERLSAVGYGENHPRRTNATPTGRAENRRVLIVVARRPMLARNMNAAPFAATHAFVRGETADAGQDAVETAGRRTAEGGLIFSN